MNWWRFVIASELRKILAYRSDFWITFVGQTMVQLLIARALWENIFASSGNEVMQGYTLQSMTLYYLLVPIGGKMLTGENIGFISREIYDGSFNRYLVYPISFFQYKTFTFLTYSAFYGVQLMLVYILYQYFVSGSLNMTQITLLFLGIAYFMVASFVYCMLSMLVELIALWADNIWSLSVMTRFFCYFFGGSYIPVEFFPDWLQKVLFYTPFPYMITLPIRVIMGKTQSSEMILGLFFLSFWGLFFMAITKLLWRKGQLRYSGVGI